MFFVYISFPSSPSLPFAPSPFPLPLHTKSQYPHTPARPLAGWPCFHANRKPLDMSHWPVCALVPRFASGYCRFLGLLPGDPCAAVAFAFILPAPAPAPAPTAAPSPGPCAAGLPPPPPNLMPISGFHIPETGGWGAAAVRVRVGVGAVRGSSAEAGGW